MAFDPRDPRSLNLYDISRHGPEAYIDRFMRDTREMLYRQLRDELHHEIRDMLFRMPQPPALPTSQPSGAILHQGISVTPEALAKLKEAEAHKVLPKVPDSIQPITAFRAWCVFRNDQNQLRLRALGKTQPWEPKKKFDARCEAGKAHPAPNNDCTCGVWAFSDEGKLLAALKNYTVSAVGQVSLWGRVIETENGFRAQYAYPKELWLFDNSLEELGYIYGVPVRTA